MKTIAMKLVTGEEIVGRVDLTDGDTYVLSYVRTIGLQQDQQGRYGVGMMDYVLSNKDCALNFTPKSYLMAFAVSPELERAYLSQTSGIQLA